jgi:uncharacterized membrane protein YsdA (DUF1294 family)
MFAIYIIQKRRAFYDEAQIPEDMIYIVSIHISILQTACFDSFTVPCSV